VHDAPLDCKPLLVRRGCLRSSGGTAASAVVGALPLKQPRTPPVAPSPLPPAWYSPSFSQMTSTELVEVEELELWVDTASNEKTEEEEEDAEDEIDEAYGCA